jgi:thymidylate synthase
MKELGVIVEANLTSNLVTKSVANKDEQAQVLLKFLYYGVEVVLNTDGGGVMNTTIVEEYERASEIIESFKTKKDLQIIEDNKRIYYDENTAPPLDERKSEYIYEPLPADRKENFTIEYLKKQAEEYKKNDVPKLPR